MGLKIAWACAGDLVGTRTSKPFFLHPLPPSHDIGLTPHFKTLQSP